MPPAQPAAPSGPPLQIAGEQHWQDLAAMLEDAVSAGLEAGAPGITIAAPAEVPLGSRATAPLSGVRVCSFGDATRLPLHAAWLVAACAETGEVRRARLVEAPEGALPDDGAKPGSGSCGTSFRLDLFSRPGIPQKPGTWVIRVLMVGEQSNTVTVRLAPSPTRFHDPAADELIEQLLRKPLLRPLNPRPVLGKGLPTYEPTPETPPLPDQPGIVLSVPRALLLGPEAKLVVRGCFRAPIQPRDVRPPPPKDAPQLRGPRATGVLPMTLLALRTARMDATAVPLVIPSYQPLAGEGEDLVGTGAFAFDLFELGIPRDEPQTVFLYALAGPLISNVAPCALVPPGALPG